jgi:hypothetical protein
MAEDCEGVMGSEKISPWDSFCFSVEIIRMVAAKTGKRCEHPADQAGGVIDEIERRMVCLKEDAPKTELDVFCPNAASSLLRAPQSLPGSGQKATFFLVLVCVRMD